MANPTFGKLWPNMMIVTITNQRYLIYIVHSPPSPHKPSPYELFYNEHNIMFVALQVSLHANVYMDVKMKRWTWKNQSMKEGSLFALFCLYLWDPPNIWDAWDCVLGHFWKLSTRRGLGFNQMLNQTHFGAHGTIFSLLVL